MRHKEEILKRINSGQKCRKDCFSHGFITHNACIFCLAFKDSPYYQGYLKDKTDDEIVFGIQELERKFDEEE